jgi:K+-transporting ATPase KdpF subunit
MYEEFGAEGLSEVEEDEMNTEYIISGLIALALLVYLVTALLKPEKF